MCNRACTQHAGIFATLYAAALAEVQLGFMQEDSTIRLPPPLPPSGDALKDPPKEVALLQDEETLFLDEDTLPAEVCFTAHSSYKHAVY